jgi:hypothetical protein
MSRQVSGHGPILGSANGAMKGKSSLRDFHSVHGCHGLVPSPHVDRTPPTSLPGWGREVDS